MQILEQHSNPALTINASTGGGELSQLLQHALENHGDRVWLETESGQATYRDIGQRAQGLAIQLQALGLVPGARVLIKCSNPIDAISALFACALVQAIFVLLHEETAAANLQHISNNADPMLMVAGTAPEADIGQHPQAGLDSAFLSSSRIFHLRHQGSSCSMTGIASILYTSGSTGRPKGVTISDANIAFAIESIHQRLQYAAHDVIGVFLPLAFDYGLYQLFLAARVGARAFVTGRTLPAPSIYRYLRERHITVFPAVAPLISAFLSLYDNRPHEFPCLRMITNTGQRLPVTDIQRLRRALPACRVYPMYGLTECKRVSILLPDEIDTRQDSVGRPLDGTRVLILDAEGRQLPPGATGEIVILGPHVTQGYWRDNDITSIRFRELNGQVALYSGDQGYLDKEGYLYFCGRNDSIIKRRGFRISISEIEHAVRSLEEIDNCVCLQASDGSLLVLFVTCSKNTSESDLRTRLAFYLESYKIPDRIVLLDQLPQTANGKTDGKALLALLEAMD